MRGLKSTTILGVVLAALAAYIFLVENKRPPSDAPKKERAWTVEADAISDITIRTAAGETTRLEKSDGVWRVAEPARAAADEPVVTAIVNALASLEIERVLDENPAGLADFGLEPARIDVLFHTSGGDATPKHLLLGERTPGSGELYAKTDRSTALVLVASYLENTFNKGTFELRDKSILHFDRTKADRLTIRYGATTLDFAKSGDVDWSMTQPFAARGDFSAIDGALAALSSTQVQRFVADDARDLGRYGLDRPELTVSVSAGGQTSTLTIGGQVDGTRYARNADGAGIFTVGENLLTDLRKGGDDFRRRDLFDFRAFTGTRIDLTRGEDTLTLEKVKGKDETSPDSWKAHTGRTTEAMKAEESLIRVTGLRADSFVPGIPAALKVPDSTVRVTFDEGKQTEMVRFFVRDADVFAVRDGEPGAARITRTAYDEALKELSSLK